MSVKPLLRELKHEITREEAALTREIWDLKQELDAARQMINMLRWSNTELRKEIAATKAPTESRTAAGHPPAQSPDDP